MKNLPKAVNFAKRNLISGKRLLLCCQNGKLTKFTYQRADYMYFPCTVKKQHVCLLFFVNLALLLCINSLTGEDISICVALAIITRLFDDSGKHNHECKDNHFADFKIKSKKGFQSFINLHGCMTLLIILYALVDKIMSKHKMYAFRFC